MSNATTSLPPTNPGVQAAVSETPAAFNSFWPLSLFGVSFLALLLLQLVMAYHQGNVLKAQIHQRQQLVQQRQELVRQRQELVQQSQKVQGELKRLVDSVIKFSKYDADAKALLGKYNITPK